MIISPQGNSFKFSFTVEAYTNNQAEYDAVLKGLQILGEAHAEFIEIIGDSLLILNQLANEYECKDSVLRGYHEKCHELMKRFKNIKMTHVPREQNVEANNLAQMASGYWLANLVAEAVDGDWRDEILSYHRNPSQSISKKVRYNALKYLLLDDHL